MDRSHLWTRTTISCSLPCLPRLRGETSIRSGRRHLRLSSAAVLTVYFDVEAAIGSAARLAAAVREARGLEEANEALHALGVRTELDLERAAATAQS